MHEYALVMLNMIKYAGIFLKKQSSEYARILNVPDAVHSIMSCTNYWAVIETESFSELCQTFKMELILQSEQCLNAGMQQETSQGREGRRFVELGHFDKHVFKNTRKRGAEEYKSLSFQIQHTFFDFKNLRGGLPSPP